MPIYEYRCSACGFQKEFLQRLNEAPHTKCTECGKRTLKKLVTAAGFQLKGTGWYATDFKNSGSKPAAKEKSEPAKEKSGKEGSNKESSSKESSSKESGSRDSSSKGGGKSDSKSSAGATSVSS